MVDEGSGVVVGIGEVGGGWWVVGGVGRRSGRWRR